MHLNIYVPRNKEDSKCWQVFNPFMLGWDDEAEIEYDYEYQGGIGMFWGFVGQNERMMGEYGVRGENFIFSDMPYFGRWSGLKEALAPDAEFYWRFAINTIHANLLDGEIGHWPNDRWAKHKIDLKPWKTNGREIILCPSSETITRYVHGMSVEQWIQRTTVAIKEYTDRPIRVRLKPRRNGTSGPDAALIPFEEDIKDAWAVVTSVSMSGVEALIHGVPNFCTSSISPTTQMGNWAYQGEFPNIEEPILKERIHLMRYLSYCQFTPKEMMSGYAREILQNQYEGLNAS